MALPVDVDAINEAKERAIEECLDLYEALVPRNVAPNGMSYGLNAMDRGQRIEAFLYRVQTGAVDMLQAISPKQFEAYVREFLDDVERTPMYAQTATMQRMRSRLEGVMGMEALTPVSPAEPVQAEVY